MKQYFSNLYKLINESTSYIDHVAMALKDPSAYYLRVITRPTEDLSGGPSTYRDGDLELKNTKFKVKDTDSGAMIYGTDVDDLVYAYDEVGEEYEEIDYS